MTVLQTKCFVNLATTKKLTETANQLNLRASTLSKYIDHMEDELSAKLFQKGQTGLELTKEGEIIYPSIQYIAKKYDDMLLDISRFASNHNMTINVGMVFHQSEMLSRLTEFSRLYPDINVTITENMASDIQHLLDTSSIDTAIIYEELLEKKYSHAVPIRKDKLVAIVGREHPLAEREQISVSELKDETFLLFKGDSLMYRFQIHACIDAGFAPRETHNNLRVSTIMEYVAANRGVSLLVENTVKHMEYDKVVVLPLIEPPTLTMSMFFPAVYLPNTVIKLMKYITSH